MRPKGDGREEEREADAISRHPFVPDGLSAAHEFAHRLHARESGFDARLVQRKGGDPAKDAGQGLDGDSLLKDPRMPLSAQVAESLAGLVGFDPSAVHIHAGAASAEAAHRIGAEAFTSGRHVFFAAGAFDPDSQRGVALLAHELIHVRQQAFLPKGGGRSIEASSLAQMEQEAIRTEAHVLARGPMWDGPLVAEYQRIYETDGGEELSDRERHKLDTVTTRALDLARLELGRRGLLEIDAHLALVTVSADVDLYAKPEEGLALDLAAAIVESIEGRIGREPAVRAPATSSIQLGQDALAAGDLVQAKQVRVRQGSATPSHWEYLGTEDGYDYYDDGEEESDEGQGEIDIEVDEVYGMGGPLLEEFDWGQDEYEEQGHREKEEYGERGEYDEYEDRDEDEQGEFDVEEQDVEQNPEDFLFDQERDEVLPPLEEPKGIGQLLTLRGKELPGTTDLHEKPEEELAQFQEAISQIASETRLHRLNKKLLERGAPQDQQRRRLLKKRMEESSFDMDEFEESNDEATTDTEGSDSEKEVAYQQDEARRRKAALRSKKEEDLLKPHLSLSRLQQLKAIKSQKGKQQGTPKKAKKEDRAAIDQILFKKGERPGKPKLYRKEAKFYDPGVPVAPRAKLPKGPTAEQMEALTLFNQLLADGIPLATAEKLCGVKFVVAQYRGLFYGPGFGKQTRLRHRNLDETDRPAFSSAALREGTFGPSGYYYLYNSEERIEEFKRYQLEIEKEARRIKQALIELRKEKPSESLRTSVSRSTQRFQPQTKSDVLAHLYTGEYDVFKKHLKGALGRESEEQAPVLDQLFKGLTSDEIPKVSTGDIPVHAARYAYGIKPYDGHEEEVLEPAYKATGKPKHPYSGKMYVSIHPITDYDEEGPLHLITLQKLGRINVRQDIIPERESQFEALLEKDRVKVEFKAKFPDFSKPYKAVYLDEYGLTLTLFNAFKDAIALTDAGTDERTFVESLLSRFLAMHSEQKMIEAAQEEAERQEAILVYRTGLRSFGFEIPEGESTEAAKRKRTNSTGATEDVPKKAKGGAKKKSDVPEGPSESKMTPTPKSGLVPKKKQSGPSIQPKQPVKREEKLSEEDKRIRSILGKMEIKKPSMGMDEDEVATPKLVLKKPAQQKGTKREEVPEGEIVPISPQEDETSKRRKVKVPEKKPPQTTTTSPSMQVPSLPQGSLIKAQPPVKKLTSRPSKLTLDDDDGPTFIFQPKPKPKIELAWVKLLKELEKKGFFKLDLFEDEDDDIPLNVQQMVEQWHGQVTRIDGHDIACFIRSLVTAAARSGAIQANQIETIVSAIEEHLRFVNLRTRGQMVDAGGLVAAEVRRVLHQLSDANFEPEVHVVMWDTTNHLLTDFQVNQGTTPVWLYYSPGHFDLIQK